MGFIGAALLVVGITILLRMMVVNRAARQARAQGENVTFREMWRRWGGVWGLMFSAGERYPGAWEGGVVVRRRKVPPKPRMWDVDVDRLEPKEEFDLADESCQVSRSCDRRRGEVGARTPKGMTVMDADR